MNLKHTMTSRQIEDLTSKRHDDVLADCDKMFNALKIQADEYLESYQDSTGRTLKQYRLDRDLTMTLATETLSETSRQCKTRH